MVWVTYLDVCRLTARVIQLGAQTEDCISRLYPQIDFDVVYIRFSFFFFIESVKENNTFMDIHLSKLHVQGLSWKTNVVLGCMDKRVFIERKMILSLNLALCVLGGQHKRILLFNPDIRWGWINRGKTDLRQCGILCLTLLKRDLHFYLWIQL